MLSTRSTSDRGALRFAGLIPILLAAASFAQAGDFSMAFRGGVTAPFGDMKDNALYGTHQGLGGVTWGLDLRWSLNARNSLRLRGDLSSIDRNSQVVVQDGQGGSLGLDSTWSVPEVGVDWRYAWNGDGRGWFMEAGAGLAFPKYALTVMVHPGTAGLTSGSTWEGTQDKRPAFRIGGGYAFSRRVFTGLAFHHVSVSKSGSKPFPIDNLTWVDLSVGIRFGMK